jgi:hypothetical protein
MDKYQRYRFTHIIAHGPGNFKGEPPIAVARCQAKPAVAAAKAQPPPVDRSTGQLVNWLTGFSQAGFTTA